MGFLRIPTHPYGRLNPVQLHISVTPPGIYVCHSLIIIYKQESARGGGASKSGKSAGTFKIMVTCE